MSLTDRNCKSCGVNILYAGRGRPREYCDEHIPKTTQWQRMHPEQVRQYQRDYYAMNKERYQERKQAWRGRPEVKEHLGLIRGEEE